MSCPRRETPGDGRSTRQGTSLLNIAGEKTGCNGTLGHLIVRKLGKGKFLRRALSYATTSEAVRAGLMLILPSLALFALLICSTFGAEWRCIGIIGAALGAFPLFISCEHGWLAEADKTGPALVCVLPVQALASFAGYQDGRKMSRAVSSWERTWRVPNERGTGMPLSGTSGKPDA